MEGMNCAESFGRSLCIRTGFVVPDRVGDYFIFIRPSFRVLMVD